MKQLLTLLLLLIACLLTIALSAQDNFTRFYGYPNDLAQERGISVTPQGSDRLLVAGTVEEIPDGGPGYSFFYVDRNDGTVVSRHYAPWAEGFRTALNNDNDGEKFALLSRAFSGPGVRVGLYDGSHLPVWEAAIDRDPANTTTEVHLLLGNTALVFHQPFVDEQTRSEVFFIDDTGTIGWTRDITPAEENAIVRVASGPWEHPLVVTRTGSGFRLHSLDRNTGNTRWRNELTVGPGLDFPRNFQLTSDRERRRILLIEDVYRGFEQPADGQLLELTDGGDLVAIHSLGTNEYGLEGNPRVTENGGLVLNRGCAIQYYANYRDGADGPENFRLCDDTEGLFSARDHLFVSPAEQYVTGEIRKTNRFDYDNGFERWNENEKVWSGNEGREGIQDEDYAVGSAPAPDGGTYLLSSTPTPASDYLAQLTLVKQNGEVDWTRQFSLSAGTSAKGLAPLPGGGCIIEASGDREHLVVSINADGTENWRQTETLTQNPHFLENFHTLVLPGGEIVSSRVARSSPTSIRETTLSVLSSIGVELRQVTVPGFSGDGLEGMALTAEGKVLLTAWVPGFNAGVRIGQFDLSTETMDWTRDFTSPVLPTMIRTPLPLPNGHLLLGYSSTATTEDESSSFTLRELDATGQTVRNNTVFDPGTSLSRDHTIALTESGNVMVLNARNLTEGLPLIARIFAASDLRLLREIAFPLSEDNGWVGLADARYLGEGRVQYYGTQGGQLFVSVQSDKDLLTSSRPELILTDQVGIYPTPANTTVWFTVGQRPRAAFIARLYDARGVLVKSQQVTNTATDAVHELDIATLPAGAYILRLSGGVNGATRVIKR